jgi:hypothetical protein
MRAWPRAQGILIPAAGPVLFGAEILRTKGMYWERFKQFTIYFNQSFGPFQGAVRPFANAGHNALIRYGTVGHIVGRD